ncbi:BTB/POZ domain-containing protein [Macrophomina phaseolina MS6]|uniref:BTB/POZ domain-containing protein n=1 Tax=Macrophomina phaseolina (strain MS6) TaxID=1126212 RepID=K2S8S0_MACPH|nr:BTB/POZ domain-containing protein [Macrophomina phaseolina MS6]
MYHGSYTHADEDTAMLFVARAYAIGDIYCVPELKDHAAAQFEELASARWDTPDFAHAMRIIYESIPEKGRGIMRDIVVHVAAQHHEVLLRVPEFQDTLDAFGVLGKDLLQALSNQLVDPPNSRISTIPLNGSSALDVRTATTKTNGTNTLIAETPGFMHT